MSKNTYVVSCLAVCLVAVCVNACAGGDDEPENGKNAVILHEDIIRFIELLTQSEAPTLAEFVDRSGMPCNTGFVEAVFEYEECKSKGWNITSDECMNFRTQRCAMAQKVPSLYCAKLRERFSTAGKTYKAISIVPFTAMDSTTVTTANIATVKIGEHTFTIQHTLRTDGAKAVFAVTVDGEVIVDVTKLIGQPSSGS